MREKRISDIEKIIDVERYIDEVNFYTPDEAKRCRILLARVLKNQVNTQPQAEEKTKLVMPPSAYEQAEKEGFNMKNKVKSELLPESTPEQTESDVQEWEKKWEEFFLYVTNDKNWVDGRPEWKGNVYITLYNAMKDFIKQLLEERERWAIYTFLKDTASYNSFHNGRPRTMRNRLSGEGFEVRVSKLNKKK